MTKDEALKLALEALKYPLNQSHENFNVDMAELLAHRAITAIEEALAQPEQEPVVWMYQDKSTHKVWIQKHMRDFVDHGQTYETPLYTTPPQRKPLTDQEIILIVADCAASHQHTDIHFARAIERAHGIKGEA